MLAEHTPPPPASTLGPGTSTCDQTCNLAILRPPVAPGTPRPARTLEDRAVTARPATGTAAPRAADCSQDLFSYPFHSLLSLSQALSFARVWAPSPPGRAALGTDSAALSSAQVGPTSTIIADLLPSSTLRLRRPAAASSLSSFLSWPSELAPGSVKAERQEGSETPPPRRGILSGG